LDSLEPNLNHDRVLLIWLPRIIAALSAAAVALIHLPYSVYPLGRDQGVWLTAGRAIFDGKIFFRDYLHFHLPGTGLIYGLAMQLVENVRHAPTLVAAGGAALTVLTIYLLVGKVISRSAGAWASVTFALFWPFGFSWWNIAQKDFLAMPFVLLATWAASAESGSRRQGAWIFIAGVFAAMAAQIKPTFLVAAVLIALGFSIRALREKELRRGLGEISWFTLGGIAAVLPLFIQLAASGALVDAWYCTTGLGATYMSHFEARPGRVLDRALSAHTSGFFGSLWYSRALLAAGFGGIALTLFDRKRPRRFWLLIPIITAPACYLIQGKGIGYHLQPWKLVLCMEIGILIAWAVRAENFRPLRWRSTVFAVIALVCFAATASHLHHSLTKTRWARNELRVFTGKLDRDRYLKKRYRTGKDYPPPRVSEKLARWINKRTKPDETVQIWGHESQIYVLADRDCATQVPFDQTLGSIPLEGNAAAWLEKQRQRFIDLLETNKPKFFIVTTKDRNPVEKEPSDKSLKNVPGLPEYLEAQYEFLRDFDRFKIYKRR
jgi:Dolichyl-phosphate-mannose-protein mannosyltransferase